MWMWTRVERIWHEFSLLPIWRFANSHTWHHLRHHVCPRSREWTRCMGNGTPLCQEFHYESIFAWFEKTKFSLSMWRLLTQHGRGWLWMSLINQQVQVWNLMPLLISASIEGFVRGTILLWWPWRCMTYLGTIWIVLSRSVPVVSTINDREIIYPCIFAFNFVSNLLVLLFNVF